MDIDCAICLESKSNEECVELKCKHSFHLNCLSKVVNNKCPLCRKSIIDTEICKNNHMNIRYFITSTYKKNGECTICGKKSYKYLFNELFNIDQTKNKLKTVINPHF